MPDRKIDELELVKKALERERIARQRLEKRLDDINQKQFEINQELLSSYESARIREVQLQFLSFLSSENIDHKSLNEMFSYFGENISNLFSKATCIVYKNVQNSITSPRIKWYYKKSWDDVKVLNSDSLLTLIPKTTSVWVRQDFNSSDEQLIECNNKPTLTIRFDIKNLYQIIITVVVEHYCYSNDFKDTLQIAANQFANILAQRLTDAELSANYQKLKRTLKKLKSTQRQLMHAEKMASLGTLAAGVAHEINNPLSYLTSNLETLKDYQTQMTEYVNRNQPLNPADTSENIKYVMDDLPGLLNDCIDGAERISVIVNGLNTFSRKNDEKLNPIDIEVPIKAAAEITNNQFKHLHKIHYELKHERKLISGNNGQLQQVFVNLLMNACHAMPNGGNIFIKSIIVDSYIEVLVQDEGCGMDEKTISRVFEPFFTTKEENKGTGLGLSISYAIMNAHNSTLHVESEPNKGTVFTLSIPLLL